MLRRGLGLARSAQRRALQTASSSAWQTPPTRLTTLDNGLRVASEASYAECDTVTVGVFIDAGSRYEAPQNNGAAHFLEHIAFKGTRARTRYQLEIEVEDMGAHLNAYTSREQTVYYAKVFRHDLRRGLGILADILQNSLLDRGAIENERSVILREMSEVNKQHEELILDLLHEAAFRSSGLGRTILGPIENIRSLQRDDLSNYIRTHYTAPRMVIAAAGAVDHEELVALSAEMWGALPTRSATDFPVDFDTARFTPTELRADSAHPTIAMLEAEKFKPPMMGALPGSPPAAAGLEEEDGGGARAADKDAHVAIAFEGASWTDDHAFSLMVLQMILGQWDRAQGGGERAPSKLARRLAGEAGCHSYMTFNTCYKDTGLFGLYLTAPPESLDAVVLAAMEHLASLAADGSRGEPGGDGALSADEVERAKTQLKASTLMQLDAFANVCEDIGRQILTYGRRMPPEEVFARIDAVTLDDVRRTARTVFGAQHALAAVGPIDKLPSYERCAIRNFA